jgi:hypothetical protein
MHQQRCGPNPVDPRGWEVGLDSFETVLYRQQSSQCEYRYVPSDCNLILPPNLLSPRRKKGVAFRMGQYGSVHWILDYNR